MDKRLTEKQNERLLALLCDFLNREQAVVDKAIVTMLMREFGMGVKEAYSYALAAEMGLNLDTSASDRALFRHYFDKMLCPLDANVFRNNPYYCGVMIKPASMGGWELRLQQYKPYEAFVCDDMYITDDGSVIPLIGFFTEEFCYPAMLECGREWMSVTPNEINTMRPAIDGAFGNVLAYGLGLGYFAYMALRKPEVASVTVVERDPLVISLVTEQLLPHFTSLDKLTIIECDAFDYAETHMASGNYDVIFTDLWHDVEDGMALYKKMKLCESKSPHSRYYYWIEPTLKCYL